jgi:hypothetical protein
MVIAILLLLGGGVGGYLMIRHGYLASKPVALPVEEISAQELENTKQRIEEFTSRRSDQPVAAPSITSTPTASSQQQQISEAEINGLIAANKRSRGHAHVTLKDNAATVDISIPADKAGLAGRYLNGTFIIKTNGPTPIDQIEVSKIEANGLPVPSNILQLRYRGRTLLGYAAEALEPYNVKTLEIRDGRVIAH